MTSNDPEATYGLTPGQTINNETELTQKRKETLEREYLALFQAVKDGTISVEQAAAEQAERVSTLETESEHDPLTGALNRRGFFERFDSDLLSFSRDIYLSQNLPEEKKPIFGTFVLLDFDNFGIINKTPEFGDIFGDRMLQFISILISAGIYPDDLFVRLGGEEFGIVFRRARIEDVVKVIERLRISLPDETAANLEGYRQTASFGVVEFPKDLKEEDIRIPTNREKIFKDTYEAAVKAKNAAKAAGRNRTVVYRGEDNYEVLEAA